MSFNRSGYIGRAPGDSAITIARKTYEPTGVQTDFTFTAGYDPGYCDVYLNGSRLISGNDYTASNGSTVGLTSAAQNGDIIEVVAYKAFNLGVPLSNITGDLSITGSVSASSSITADNGVYGTFYGSGSGLTGVASTDYIITGTAATFNSQVKVLNLNVTGVSTVSTALHVGTALTANAAGDVETIGIITAASFSGNGANLTSLPTGTTITVADESSDTTCFPSFFTAATGNLAPKTGTNLTFNSSSGALTATSFVGALTGAVTGNSTGLTGTPNISCGTIAGSTGTFSGAVNVDDTTDSTSATSGALIVDGGLGVAKNVYIGAGLSVAGTLTYEDVTNVDSVGLITAKSGVNVTGGQIQVGAAFSVGPAGVVTAASYYGDGSNLSNITSTTINSNADNRLITGSGTANTLNGETNLTFDGASFKVGSGITMAATSGVVTFANGSATANNITLGNGKLRLYHDGTGNGYMAMDQSGGSGNLYITGTGNANIQISNSYTAIGPGQRLITNDSGVVISGIVTAAGAAFTPSTGPLREKVRSVAGKLSDLPNINLQFGMVQYFSVQETTTSTPNIRFSDYITLNNKMSTGEVVVVTIITTAAAAAYSAQMTIDGAAQTEEWVGGSAPSAGGSDGLDIYSYTIIKTADATFKVIANYVNATN